MKRTGNQVLGSTTLNIPVAAGENMKECTIAAINTSGYAVTGKKAEGLVKAGMVVVGADNTGGAAGAPGGGALRPGAAHRHPLHGGGLRRRRGTG